MAATVSTFSRLNFNHTRNYCPELIKFSCVRVDATIVSPQFINSFQIFIGINAKNMFSHIINKLYLFRTRMRKRRYNVLRQQHWPHHTLYIFGWFIISSRMLDGANKILCLYSRKKYWEFLSNFFRQFCTFGCCILSLLFILKTYTALQSDPGCLYVKLPMKKLYLRFCINFLRSFCRLLRWGKEFERPITSSVNATRI